MHKLDELRDMLMDELEKCSDKGELSAGSLEVIDKLAHAIKSIDTIVAMEDAGYSNEYSNARGRGKNARRDSMGRYSSDDMSYDDMMYDDMSYDEYERRGNRGGRSRTNRGRSYRGYSRDDAKKELAKDLRELAMDADDSETKQMIHKWIKQVEG